MISEVAKQKIGEKLKKKVLLLLYCLTLITLLPTDTGFLIPLITRNQFQKQ